MKAASYGLFFRQQSKLKLQRFKVFNQFINKTLAPFYIKLAEVFAALLEAVFWEKVLFNMGQLLQAGLVVHFFSLY